MTLTRTASVSNLHPADGKAIRKIPLTGTNSITLRNGDTDGNYVVIEDSKGYCTKYAHILF